MTHIDLDLETLKLFDLSEIKFSGAETVAIFVPMPSIGRTNQYIDICSDYVDASWAIETLSTEAGSAEVVEEYLTEAHLTRLRLTVTAPGPSFRERLEDVVVVFQAQQDDGSGESERYQGLRDSIADYEESLADRSPRFPELIESYFANFVSGALHEMRFDAPDYFDELIKKHPEYELGFHKSPYSSRLGADCYASIDSWLIPNSFQLDAFFSVTGQKYRRADFTEGQVLVIAGKSVLLSGGLITWFPMSQYFKSRVCAGFARRHDEEIWPPDQFAWEHASFTHSPFGEYIREVVPEGLKAEGPRRESCLVHNTGTMIVINDGINRHVLYDTRPLDERAVKNLHDTICTTTRSVAAAMGLSDSLSFDWKSLSDEQFEQICYDILYAHAMFDSSTIRKLGNSRSRDGGRDIEIREAAKTPGGRRRRWIFQCKLTQGKSLSATKVQDVGDMLDQYEAEGFGVMTSALIDATLYDKIDSVCGRRSIETLNFSVLEINRTLVRNPSIRKRYFPES